MRSNGQPDAKNRYLCQWPGCDSFSNWILRRGEETEWKSLCHSHRRLFYQLTDREIDQMYWQEKRIRFIADDLVTEPEDRAAGHKRKEKRRHRLREAGDFRAFHSES